MSYFKDLASLTQKFDQMNAIFKKTTFRRNRGVFGFAEEEGHALAGLVAHKPKCGKWQIYHARSGAKLGKHQYPNLKAVKAAIRFAVGEANWDVDDGPELQAMIAREGRRIYEGMKAAGRASR